MKPLIKSTKSGGVNVGDRAIEYDFFINSDGEIVRRFKDASGKNLHMLSLSEANDYFDPNVNELIIGWRHDDKMMLSNEATDFFEEKRCKIKLLPLQEAITYWNRYEGRAVGLFHISK